MPIDRMKLLVEAAAQIVPTLLHEPVSRYGSLSAGNVRAEFNRLAAKEAVSIADELLTEAERIVAERKRK